MGRPVEVTDEEIIAAGHRLLATLPAGRRVTATALWVACGRHGRADRMLRVWEAHAEAQQESRTGTAAPATMIPDEVRQQGAALARTLSEGIDRAIATMYSTVQRMVCARYERELAALTDARTEIVADHQEALEALSSAGDDLQAREDEIARLKAILTATERQRDVAAALHAAEVEARQRAEQRCTELEAARGECAAALAASQAREALLGRQLTEAKAELATLRAGAAPQPVSVTGKTEKAIDQERPLGSVGQPEHVAVPVQVRPGVPATRAKASAARIGRLPRGRKPRGARELPPTMPAAGALSPAPAEGVSDPAPDTAVLPA